MIKNPGKSKLSAFPEEEETWRGEPHSSTGPASRPALHAGQPRGQGTEGTGRPEALGSRAGGDQSGHAEGRLCAGEPRRGL